MNADDQDDHAPKKDAKTPQMWAREGEPPGAQTCPAPEEDEGQMIEEPGYGHGV